MDNKFLIRVEAWRDRETVDWGVSHECTNVKSLPELPAISGAPEPYRAAQK